MIKTIFKNITSLIYTDLCLICQEENPTDQNRICTGCIINMPFTQDFKYDNNESSAKFWGRFPYEYAASLIYYYNYTDIKKMLHSLKYRGKRQVGEYLGEIAGKRAIHYNRFTDVDIIIPVPIHWQKKVTRGYNQSEVIANALSKELNVPVRTDVMSKEKPTDSQTKKNRLSRVKNVYDSFEIKNINDIQGRHILIVDDVLTTGATIEACARKLLQIDGVKISILTICLARN